MIKGLDKLTKEQKNLMKIVNKIHIDCVGLEYKQDMEIKEVWLDKNNTVCVRLKNGDWFHYLKNCTWY